MSSWTGCTAPHKRATVKAILGDINIQGHMQVLVTLLEGEVWRDLWSSLQLTVLTFLDVGLSPRASDAVVWQTCQQEQIDTRDRQSQCR
jgi:hypothetical protein